jgi:hypothetical protein
MNKFLFYCRTGLKSGLEGKEDSVYLKIEENGLVVPTKKVVGFVLHVAVTVNTCDPSRFSVNLTPWDLTYLLT